MNPASDTTFEKLALFESGESCDSECTIPTPGDENHPYNQVNRLFENIACGFANMLSIHYALV